MTACIYPLCVYALYSVADVERDIEGFHRRFNAIKDMTIKRLEQCQMTVMVVVYILTSIIAVGEHKMFLEGKHKVLHDSKNNWELFSLLNFYWNYLAYDLLDQLIKELCQKNKAFDAVRGEMEDYKRDIQKFREHTALEIFCQADPNTLEDDPPPGFRTVAIKFNWSNGVTLEKVEKFRKRFARKYNLQKCAMMLNSIRPGSFTVTWFVPVTVVEMMTKNRALKIFREFDTSRVDSDGTCIYQTSAERHVS